MPLAEINRMVQQIGAGRYLQQQPEMAVRELQETAARLITMAEQIGRTNENLLVAQKILKQQENSMQPMTSLLLTLQTVIKRLLTIYITQVAETFSLTIAPGVYSLPRAV